MATRKGLEPSTSGVTGRRSNQLNYRARWYRRQKGSGRNNRTRTCDILLVRQALYQLSYAPKFRCSLSGDEIYYTRRFSNCQHSFYKFSPFFFHLLIQPLLTHNVPALDMSRDIVCLTGLLRGAVPLTPPG